MSDVPEPMRGAVELLGRIAPTTRRGPHAAGWSLSLEVAPDPSLVVTEAVGGYLVTSLEVEDAALWVDQTAAAADFALIGALARQEAGARGVLDGVLMPASEAATFGFPRMNAIVLGTLHGAARDPWIFLVGSTAPDAIAQGGRRMLPTERARLEVESAAMLEPRIAAAHSLREWAASRGVVEAYRVTREPSTHGGQTGWRVTVWRSGEAWRKDVTPLTLFTPAPATGSGVPMPTADAARVLAAVEASSFWNDSSPKAMGLDGYHVFYEGVCEGGAHDHTAWCPKDAMFAVFASLAGSVEPSVDPSVDPMAIRSSSGLGCWLALLAAAGVVGGAIYLLW